MSKNETKRWYEERELPPQGALGVIHRQCRIVEADEPPSPEAEPTSEPVQDWTMIQEKN